MFAFVLIEISTVSAAPPVNIPLPGATSSQGSVTVTVQSIAFKLIFVRMYSLYPGMNVPCSKAAASKFSGGVAARIMKTPLLIHEQNAVAGMTNKLLSKIASQVLQAFPGAFDDIENLETVGNPVRAEIANIAEPEARYTSREGALRLLIIGGSLGAVALNENVPPAIALISESLRPEIRHQAGRANKEDTKKFYRFASVDAEVVEFVGDMAEAYAWADLVICRSGALTVAEIAAAGVASIFVPYPHAVDDHQTVNAKSLTDVGAGLLMQQDKLTPRSLHEVIKSFAHDDMAEVRQRLLHMAQAARTQAKPDATQNVVKWCNRLAQLPADQSNAGNGGR